MNAADRFMIQEELSRLGAMVSLDETHPAGDPVVEGLWSLALIGADARTEDPLNSPFARDRVVASRAARAVAAALMVANFGPRILESEAVR